MEFLKALINAPIAVLFLLVGFAFLAFAIFQVSLNVKPVRTGKATIRRQILAGSFGLIFIMTGTYIAGRTGQLGPTPTDTPTPTGTESVAEVTSTSEVATSAPTTVPVVATTPSEQPPPSIAISEVMASPCTPKGWKGGPSSNEYIELYNYGSQPVDVAGWWIGTNGGDPQKIVAWNTRNPNSTPEGTPVLTKTSVIPPSKYALILAPLYLTGDPGMRQPYSFLESTIILTVAQGKYLGNDRTGLLGYSEPRTVIALYEGTQTSIALVDSTYGSPTVGNFPGSIVDNGQDGIPLAAPDCHAAVRTDRSGPDSADNWQLVNNGSPGRP